MIRTFLAGLCLAAFALFVLLFVSVPGWTKPICDNIDVMRPCAPIFQAERVSKREARRIARGQRLEQAMPFGAAIERPETQRSFLAHGTTILPHPPGCPRRAFCGCGAAVEVFGRPVRSLWLAANWLAFPRTSPAPGMVAARRGHVFVIKEVLGGGKVLAYDANSGGRRTRLHVRSLAGFAVVNPHG